MIGCVGYVLKDGAFGSISQFKKGMEILSIVAGVVGLLTIVYALLAIAALRIKRAPCVISYSCFGFLLVLCLTAISVALLTLIAFPDSSIQGFC
jgi:hypothetical protein